jgi:hypothetical protein
MGIWALKGEPHHPYVEFKNSIGILLWKRGPAREQKTMVTTSGRQVETAILVLVEVDVLGRLNPSFSGEGVHR